jgi:hypothetical protein
MPKPNRWLPWLFLGFLAAYSLYSFTQVDPNLVLSSQPWLWYWQQLAWNLGYHQRFWSSVIYLVIIIGLFGCYAGILKKYIKIGYQPHQLTKILAGAIICLSFSYPALSHDIYNYLFNAKMVLVYHANPHVKVALDFPTDPWLKFMNNIHTPAPYAYGWTAISLIPSFLGLGHLKITVLIFRGLMIISLGLLLLGQKRLMPKGNEIWFWAFALNPLVLIETIGNVHNDVVMMALVIWAIVLAKKALNGNRWWWPAAGALLILSVSVKYASLMVLVGWGLYLVSQKWKRKLSLGGAQIIANFIPLLTNRSQHFLPWYLIWPLSFLPLSQEKLLNLTLVLFSVTGLLSYLPYIFTGEYTAQQSFIRTLILFVPPISFVLTALLIRPLNRNRS